MDNTVKVLLSIAAVVGTVAAGIYISQHVSWGCILGTCGIITH